MWVLGPNFHFSPTVWYEQKGNIEEYTQNKHMYDPCGNFYRLIFSNPLQMFWKEIFRKLNKSIYIKDTFIFPSHTQIWLAILRYFPLVILPASTRQMVFADIRIFRLYKGWNCNTHSFCFLGKAILTPENTLTKVGRIFANEHPVYLQRNISGDRGSTLSRAILY